jgi:hypothetical protein
MTDRPIIFSGPMVRALLDGRKTQTRRLATSPLRRVQHGDRLYVREHWRVSSAQNAVAPRDLPKELSVEFVADGLGHLEGKHRQGMHMPRWASRLTLTVERVRVEPLLQISDADALAEGVRAIAAADKDGMRHFGIEGGTIDRPTPAHAFAELWSSLHVADGECWSDNPDVVALTFRVECANIDAQGA